MPHSLKSKVKSLCYKGEITEKERDRIIKALEQEQCDDMGEVSDGYHTFNQLYHQRAVLFATIVNQNKDKSWKSFKHSDGNYCFDSNGEWFIVGIDTPQGSYTYHYAKEYWDMFDCQELECGKEWDGHTEEDVTRLLSLQQQFCEDCISREAAIDVVRKWFDKIQLNGDICLDGIVSLPSVTPQQPKMQDCEHCIHTYGTLGCCDMVNNEWIYDCEFGKEQYNKEHEQELSEDCISRKEALRHRHIIYDDDGVGYSVVRVDEIEQLPSVTPQQTCEDCISRTKLLSRIDAERKHLLNLKMDGAEHIIVHHARRIIEDMPSVTLQQPCEEENPNCIECRYYDKEKHHCPRFCRVIEDTMAEITSKQTEWIPIKTRPLTEEEKEYYASIGWSEDSLDYIYSCPLPDDGEEVLITDMRGHVELDTFYSDDGCYFEYNCDADEVLAWMPLPEGYKPESEDKE